MSHKTNLLIIAPGDIRKRFLGALIDAYKENDIIVDYLGYNNHVPDENELSDATDNKNAVLYFFPGNRSPRTIINHFFLINKSGKKVPVGLVPIKDNLNDFVQCAAKVHTRIKDVLTMALLAQRHPRYIRITNRIETILNEKPDRFPFFKWTGDVIFREDMVKGLNGGIGIALYVGHGRPVGWVGYYGLRIRHFENPENPIGAMISLCCHTASRRKVGISFAEQMVLKGISASGVGAVTSTLYSDNTRWAVQLTDIISSEVYNIGDLLIKACPLNDSAYKPYRLFGDPLSPIQTSLHCVENANNIKVYI